MTLDGRTGIYRMRYVAGAQESAWRAGGFLRYCGSGMGGRGDGV